jgi:DNA sulfur modification protein DndC
MNATENEIRRKYPAYCLRKLPLSPRIKSAIELIKNAYESDSEPWIVGFSGGKDSSCVLKLLFHAIRLANFHHKPVTVLYCDTGVEIPLAARLAHDVLNSLKNEASKLGLPIGIKIVSPPLKDHFFVKVIGRGYPPPTDKFRWCTDRLRINPISNLLHENGHDKAIVVIGVRQDESNTRAQTLKKYNGSSIYWKRQKTDKNRRLFTPIIDFNLTDVWQTLLLMPTPHSVHGRTIADLYANASGECPTIRDPDAAPCGAARFGCWTCTVAKNGTTLRNLIQSGRVELIPLLEFRLWLDKYRNDENYRWKTRRNGKPGLGPMTMRWRRMALEKLIKAEAASGFSLIDEAEIEAIKNEWRRE